MFRVVKLYCIMLYWWIRVTTDLSKSTKYTTQTVVPLINNIIMYQYWLINFNKCTAIMKNVNNRGNYVSLYFPSIFL